MYKKILFLSLASLVLAGCSILPGSKEDGASTDLKTDNIPLSVDDGNTTDLGITLENPKEDAVLVSPFLVSGKAEVPGNKVYVRIKNAEDKSVIEAFTMAKNGVFGVNMDFAFKGTTEGSVEVFGKDESGAEVSLESVKVKFEPNL